MTTPKYENKHWKEEFEDAKGVIRIRKLKKNRQQNKVKKTSRFVITHVVHYSILVNKQQSMYYLGVYLNFNFEQSNSKHKTCFHLECWCLSEKEERIITIRSECLSSPFVDTNTSLASHDWLSLFFLHHPSSVP
jgi:hypothetical protein